VDGKQPWLFDIDEWLRRLSDIDDQFEAFAAVLDLRPSASGCSPLPTPPRVTSAAGWGTSMFWCR
jgi:hypothetical protein